MPLKAFWFVSVNKLYIKDFGYLPEVLGNFPGGNTTHNKCLRTKNSPLTGNQFHFSFVIFTLTNIVLHHI